ncbi:hypothetical protein [Novosphingobium soli]|uniref:Energy transducer TonB n=1 Tax=Novosphingobium soli TaxID=574956 RepID=A0ABV6CT50_9SPHN
MAMVDILALSLSHGLLLLAAWRLLGRADLDDEGREAGTPPRPRTLGAPMRVVRSSDAADKDESAG